MFAPPPHVFLWGGGQLAPPPPLPPPLGGERYAPPPQQRAGVGLGTAGRGLTVAPRALPAGQFKSACVAGWCAVCRGSVVCSVLPSWMGFDVYTPERRYQRASECVCIRDCESGMRGLGGGRRKKIQEWPAAIRCGAVCIHTE